MAKKEKKIRIFSALEVANICGVVNQTAINWIKNGFLKAFTTPGGQYRVYEEDLLEFLTSRGMRIPEELAGQTAGGLEWGRILIVDDDENLNNLLKRFLSKKMARYSILQAFDGFEAGRMVAEWRPGAIILDINLPGIDGHKLCQKIKSDPGLKDTVIIAITGMTEGNDEAAIRREGADAFFFKPVDLEKLRESIENLVGERGGGNGHE